MEKVLTTKLPAPVKQDDQLPDNGGSNLPSSAVKETVPYRIDPALVNTVSVDHLTPGDREQAIRTIKACQLAKLPIMLVPQGLHSGHGYEVNNVTTIENFKDLGQIEPCGIKEYDDSTRAYQIFEPGQYSEKLHLTSGLNPNDQNSTDLALVNSAVSVNLSVEEYPIMEGVVILKKDNPSLPEKSVTPLASISSGNQESLPGFGNFDPNSPDLKRYN